MKFLPLITLSLSVLASDVLSFVVVRSHQSKTPTKSTRPLLLASLSSSTSSSITADSFAVPAADLEKNLSPDERTVVQVVRKNGPSVAFVTSVLPLKERPRKRNGRGQKAPSSPLPKREKDSNLPLGRSLGSGSGFVVDASGYLLTNFHVIEMAYRMQSMGQNYNLFLDDFAANVTKTTGISSEMVNATLQKTIGLDPERPQPSVYVRINSATNYQKCRIVSVEPELDVAVLKIVDPQQDVVLNPFTFGSSSDLLVGQSLIAIGNPFGLDNSVTTGVVSAMNRELRTASNNNGLTATARPIRNCIQTDCAINPGNSGGPLLNLQGQVVGMNTAIITTSGSNAGIGFAVPADQIQPAVDDIIRKDKMATRKQVWMGVTILKRQGGSGTNSTSVQNKNWIVSVKRGTPAAMAGMRPLRLSEETASVEYGDAVVAVSGNQVDTYAQLQAEIDRCVPGEKVSVTLEDAAGERRVVYLEMVERPPSKKNRD